MGDEFRPVAAVCPFAGLRVGEALALHWRDVDLDAGMLDVHGTKTEGSKAPVPMIDALVVELRGHQAREKRLARVPRGDAWYSGPAMASRRTGTTSAGRSALLATPPGSTATARRKWRRMTCVTAAPRCCSRQVFRRRRSRLVLRHAGARTTLLVYAGVVESQRAALRDDLTRARRFEVAALARAITPEARR